MNQILRIEKRRILEVDGQKMWSRQLNAIDSLGNSINKFNLMAAAIEEDVLGGGDGFWNDVFAKMESREADYLELDGNAWVIYVTPEKVWFEGLYGQGEGGDVTYFQFKLAVEAFNLFLSDPERKTIEIEF